MQRGAHTMQQGAHTMQRGAHTMQRGAHTMQRGAHTMQRGAHTMQQLPRMPITFFEVLRSNSTDTRSEVSYTLLWPNKLVQQGMAVGVDNGTPEISRRSTKRAEGWCDTTGHV